MTKPFNYISENGDDNWEWIWQDFRFMIYRDADDGSWHWICVSNSNAGDIMECGEIPHDMRILMEVEDE